VVLRKSPVRQLCSNQETTVYPSRSTSRRDGVRHARFTRVSPPAGDWTAAGVQANA
jgi:hypothetical protein